MKKRSNKFASGRTQTPEEFVTLFPTPCAMDAKAGDILNENTKIFFTRTGAPRKISTNGIIGSVGLSRFAKLFPTPKAQNGNSPSAGLWPTPSTGKIGGGSGAYKKLKEKCTAEKEVKQMGGGWGNKLNPDWVEALMGYPDGWTDITQIDVQEAAPYPERWIDGTWEKSIPRVTAKAENRIARLKCLGNAIVPQVAHKIWVLIRSFYGETQA